MRLTGYFPEVLSLELDYSKCNHCGMCVKVCPHGVFEIENKKVKIVGHDFCMECGACKLNCSQGAILLDIDDGCGCAAGIIEGAIKGTSPACGCSSQNPSCN